MTKQIKYITERKAKMWAFFGVLLGMAIISRSNGYVDPVKPKVDTPVKVKPVQPPPIMAAMVIPKTVEKPAPKKEVSYMDQVDKVLLTAEKKSLARHELIYKYHDDAKLEQEKFGIPVSIKLGQMIIEGGFKDGQENGTALVRYANNPFGIKYQRDYYPNTVPYDLWPKLAHKGEYFSYHDDCGNNKCKFIHFQSMWCAIRFHSYFLAGTPDKRSKYYVESNNWRDWVKSLQKNGYATSDQYAKLLTKVIKDYKLYLLD